MESIGERLARIRKEKGLTQQMLADTIGATQRVITYYERESDSIPASKIVEIVKTLGISSDELLGLIEEKKPRGAQKNAYLKRKLELVEGFSKKDQKTIINMIDALAQIQDTTNE